MEPPLVEARILKIMLTHCDVMIVLLIIFLTLYALQSHTLIIPITTITSHKSTQHISRQKCSQYNAIGKKNYRNKEENDVRESGHDANLDFIGLAGDERLQKVIARAGIASRRAAERMVHDIGIDCI